MSAFFDAMLGRLAGRDVEIPLGVGQNFKAPFVLALNAVTKFVEITLEDASIGPVSIAPSTSNFGIPFIIGPVAFVAGTPGTADDITIMLSAPYDFKIVDVILHVETDIGGSTVRLRDTAGGAGSALSSALSSAASGMVRNNDNESRDVNETGSVFLRRSDRGVSGEVTILAVRL